MQSMERWLVFFVIFWTNGGETSSSSCPAGLCSIYHGTCPYHLLLHSTLVAVYTAARQIHQLGCLHPAAAWLSWSSSTPPRNLQCDGLHPMNKQPRPSHKPTLKINYWFFFIRHTLNTYNNSLISFCALFISRINKYK